jgi:sulfoxide reductase heme-binding subunit YedZ
VLRLLAITLAVTPVRQLTGLSWLVKYRRMLGLFAFAYAIVHVSCFVVFDHFFAWGEIGVEIIKHKYITVGMLAFTTMLPLVWTSTKASIRRMGKRWQTLHRLVYLTAIAGTIHYLWAVKKDTFFPLVYVAVFALLLGYRVARWRTTRTTAALCSPRPNQAGPSAG